MPRSKRLAFLGALLPALAAFALPLYAQQASPKPITLAAIVDAMEVREKRAASISVRWTHWVRWKAPLSKTSEFTYPCEVLLKGGSMRYVHKQLSHAGADVSLIDSLETWDGNESRRLVGGEPPHGSIDAEREAVAAALLPLMLYFRPLTRLNHNSLKLADGRKSVDGHECVTIDDGGIRVDLDCGRDFLPVAFQAYVKGGRVCLVGSLEYYHKNDAIRWVPKTFLAKWFGHGFEERHRGDYVQTEIGASLKDSDFALVFEPGTVVWNVRTREEYRIRSDRSKEPIDRRRRRKAPAK
jgi:hypothetical protein